MSRPLFLVGYRGTGKTTVARLLAGRLDWAWLDADAALETRHGKTIREIFVSEGEAGFRDKEAELLREFCGLERHVIATGGGVVLRPENRRCLRSSGTIVWLHADAPILWQRLQQDATTNERRPNLTVGGLVEIEELLRVRRPLYEEVANLQLDTAGRSPPEIAEEILTSLDFVRARSVSEG